MSHPLLVWRESEHLGWFDNSLCATCRRCCGPQVGDAPYPMPLLASQCGPGVEERLYMCDAQTAVLDARGCKALGARGCTLARTSRPPSCGLFPILLNKGAFYVYTMCPAIDKLSRAEWQALARSARDWLCREVSMEDVRRLSLSLPEEFLQTKCLDLDVRLIDDLDSHTAWFRDYVEGEKARETEDVGPMELKYEHTQHVLENAQSIVDGENPTPRMRRAALLAALYHDIARFSQYRIYRTFKDRDSIDHGRYGLLILKQTACLQEEETSLRHLVSTAVLLHNRFQLPKSLAADALWVTRLVRDADKLDILRVIDGHLSREDHSRQTVLLQLPDDPKVWSPVVIEAALNDRVAAYGDLRSVNDFRVLLASWIHDMNFPASTRQFIAQGYARHIVSALPGEGVYARVKAHLLQQLALKD